jgi:hypothetical protein
MIMKEKKRVGLIDQSEGRIESSSKYSNEKRPYGMYKKSIFFGIVNIFVSHHLNEKLAVTYSTKW